MTIEEAAQVIAEFLDCDATRFLTYTKEDTIGGWHPDETIAKWGCGAIWESEGQILYALVRMFKPQNVVEIGNFQGCSTTHLAAALYKNKSGHLTSFDLYPLANVAKKYRKYTTLFTHDLFRFNYDMEPKIDLLFQDDYHSENSTEYVWRNFKQYALPGAIIITHDSEHSEAGKVIRAGIKSVVDQNYLSIVIEPSACGLAMWRKSC